MSKLEQIEPSEMCTSKYKKRCCLIYFKQKTHTVIKRGEEQRGAGVVDGCMGHTVGSARCLRRRRQGKGGTLGGVGGGGGGGGGGG